MNWLTPVLFIICLIVGASASLAGVWLGCWISWRWGRREKLLQPKTDWLPLRVSDNEIDDDDKEEFVEDIDTLEKATM